MEGKALLPETLARKTENPPQETKHRSQPPQRMMTKIGEPSVVLPWLTAMQHAAEFLRSCLVRVTIWDMQELTLMQARLLSLLAAEKPFHLSKVSRQLCLLWPGSTEQHEMLLQTTLTVPGRATMTWRPWIPSDGAIHAPKLATHRITMEGILLHLINIDMVRSIAAPLSHLLPIEVPSSGNWKSPLSRQPSLSTTVTRYRQQGGSVWEMNTGLYTSGIQRLSDVVKGTQRNSREKAKVIRP